MPQCPRRSRTLPRVHWSNLSPSTWVGPVLPAWMSFRYFSLKERLSFSVREFHYIWFINPLIWIICEANNKHHLCVCVCRKWNTSKRRPRWCTCSNVSRKHHLLSVLPHYDIGIYQRKNMTHRHQMLRYCVFILSGAYICWEESWCGCHPWISAAKRSRGGGHPWRKRYPKPTC